MSDHYCCSRCHLRYDDCVCPKEATPPGPKQPPRLHGDGCICGDFVRPECPARPGRGSLSIGEAARREILAAFGEVQRLREFVESRYVGRRALITSDFNDQPIGRSRSSLRGKVVTIRAIFIDSHSDQPTVSTDEYRCHLRLDELEIL